LTHSPLPGPHRSASSSDASPTGAPPSERHDSSSVARPLLGLLMITALTALIALAISLYQNRFVETVAVTVISQRAGLVMNPDAKVKIRGIPVGRVVSIATKSDGTTALRLALDASQLHFIPANVGVDIASSTVFGAKFVQFKEPSNPSEQRMYAGQVIRGDHVMVEINTIFERLVAVLDKVNPAKLNETLGAIASAFNGRGDRIGKSLENLNTFLAKIESSYPNLSHDIETAGPVLNAYSDAAPDLVNILQNSTRISRSIDEEQKNLDAFLLSAIGLADNANAVIGGNRKALTDVLHLLVPTTSILNKYHDSLWCGIAGIIPFTKMPTTPVPGAPISAALTLGTERYRYPQDLPKVAAKGRSYCKELGLPDVPPEFKSPIVIGDVGSNPMKYGNQGILLNSDALKQYLFGPVPGPPRNTPQTGMPG